VTEESMDYEALLRAGQKLLMWRKQAGYSQRDVEQLTGGAVLAQDVSRLENGRVGRPSAYVISKLCELYGKSPNELFELFGLWKPSKQIGDHRIDRLIEVSDALPPGHRERLLRMVETLTTVAEQEAKMDVKDVRERPQVGTLPAESS
jgi:transcriptional regulator with XRE-family HTH domain